MLTTPFSVEPLKPKMFEITKGSKAKCQNCGKTISSPEIRLRYSNKRKDTHLVSKSLCLRCLAQLLIGMQSFMLDFITLLKKEIADQIQEPGEKNKQLKEAERDRIVDTLMHFQLSNDQLKRIEEILNE